jgi:polar amino acid transport system substrate-binding protein
VIPGYALVGRVIGWGASVPSSLHNATVLCAGTAHSSFRLGWGGHVSHAVAASDDVVPVATGVEIEEAVLTHLAAISYRGMRMAAPRPGETVAVLGLGPIGQLSARLFAQAGADVVAGGIDREHVRIVERAGIKAVVVEEDSIRSIKKLLPGGASIVVDATGNPNALPFAVELAAQKPWNDSSLGGAKVVVQGSHTGAPGIPYGAAFDRELTMLWPRFCQRSDRIAVMELLAKRALAIRDLLTEIVSPQTAPGMYERLRDNRNGVVTAAFRWDAPEGGPDAEDSAPSSVKAKPKRGLLSSFMRRGK